MKDENEIAHRITQTVIAGGSRALRVEYARKGGQASVAAVPMDQRRANGLKGAIARWGTLKERDNHPMPASRKNLDMNQLAKRILDEATGEEPKTPAPPEQPAKNKAAVALGKLGGKKGGTARAAALTPEQRAEIAKKAAETRWGKKTN